MGTSMGHGMHKAVERWNMPMGRTENINVFQDTMNLCKNNDRIRESVHNSAEGQNLILEGVRLQNQIRSDTKRKHGSRYQKREPLKRHWDTEE